MAVIEDIPDALSDFYGDDYYGGDLGSGMTNDSGYSDYSFTAEHGVGWAAELIKVLGSSGSVIDIGCADGTLLLKLKPDFELYGIEVNEVMAARAERHGIHVISHDLMQPDLADRYGGKFDFVSAIAVFEHLRDIRAGFAAALHLMRDDGVLLFEVPLMSESEDNTVWLSSSLEHVWYPSREGLTHLIEAELGCYLIGCEINIRNFASNYIGVVTKNETRLNEISPIVRRVLLRCEDATDPREQIARMRIGLIHAAQTTHHDLDAVALLSSMDFNPMLVRRLIQVWQNDIWRLLLVDNASREVADALADARSEAETARSRLDALTNDSVRNEIELTREILRLATEVRGLRARLEAADASLGAVGASGDGLTGELVSDADAPLAAQASPGISPLRASAIPAIEHPGEASASVEPPKLIEATGHRPSPFTHPSGPWPAERPLVSVVITSFNYGSFVADAVGSVLAQTFRDLEVIVVEGGSSDETSRLCVAEFDRSRVRVLMQGAGHLAGANRNYGISQARGKYVCCLDADDMLRPTYLEKAVFLLERHGCDVVSAAQELFGRETTVYHVEARPDLALIMEANHVLTCAVFRRTFWDRAGGFRDTDRAATGYVYEDWSFWVRIAALGARVINLARDPMLLYRVHGISLSRRPEVLSLQRQRELIGILNADVISREAQERSYRAARARPGTPVAPRPPVRLEGRGSSEVRPAGPTLLLAMPFLILGGAERLLSSIVGGLAREGWRVVVMTSIEVGAEHGDATPWFESFTPEIFHLPRFLDPDYWNDFLFHLVESRQIELLWVVGSAFAYDALRSLKSRFPGLMVADLLFNTKGHTANNRRRSALIDLIFVENDEVRRWLLARDEAPERIRLIESGVDLRRLNPSLRSPEWRERMQAGSDDLVIGYCGRWSEEKDPLAFVEIARRSDPAWPVRFVMTGTGALRPEIEAAIGEARFPPGRFELLGEIPDIEVALASLDLLVVPSRLDGRPVVVMEAAAVGTPVLASRVGGLPDLIDDDATGWLCRPEVIDDFVAVVGRATADRARLLEMRRTARAKAERQFDVERMLAEYERDLRSLLPVAS